MSHLSHLNLAHMLWKNLLQPQQDAIDCTCGNGYDTLFLAQHLKEGHLYSFDIQKEAITNTQDLLKKNSNLDLEKKITFFQTCHTHIDLVPSSNISLIVYNLGYLPKGDKKITTLIETTLDSIKKALNLICLNGVISITCYPGHEEGKVELDALLTFCKSLDPQKWKTYHYNSLNQEKSPALILIQKKPQPS